MFYNLENVLIPDLYRIKKEFDLIDILEWYTRLLLEHVTKPGNLHGLPLSLYVLKDLSGMKKRLRESRIPEIIDIISCLCDVACAVHLNNEIEDVHLCKPQQQKKSSLEGTFLNGQNKNKSNLLKMIKNHIDLFPKLLCAKVKFGGVRRELDLCEEGILTLGNSEDPGLNVNKAVEERFLAKKLKTLKSKDSKELKNMEKVVSEFEELGGEISKLANIIQEQILRRTKDQINNIYSNFKTLLYTCKFDNRYEIVDKTLKSYWKGDISDKIYKYYSDMYQFPVIKSTTTFTKWGYLIHLQSPTILYCKLRSDDEIEIIFQNSSYGRLFTSSNCKHQLSPSCRLQENGFIKEKQVEHKISIVGAAVCSEPSLYNLQRATIFQDENRPYDPCGKMPGNNADPRCHTIFQVFGYVVTCGSLLVALTAIYLYLNTRLHIAMPKFRLEQKKKNAWIKVQDSLYKGVVNMIPPASTGVNGVKLPPIRKAMRKRFVSPNEIQPFDLQNTSDLEKDDLAKESKEDNIAPFGNSQTTNEESDQSKTDLEVSMANGQ